MSVTAFFTVSFMRTSVVVAEKNEVDNFTRWVNTREASPYSLRLYLYINLKLSNSNCE